MASPFSLARVHSGSTLRSSLSPCTSLGSRPSRRHLSVSNCIGCFLENAKNLKVVRVAGRTIPNLPIPPDFPGTYPNGFYANATGEDLPNKETFSKEFRSSLEKLLKPKAPNEYEAFMQTGMCNDRQHQWVILHLPPHTYFPVHAHPGLEIVYVVSGSMHEIRLSGKVDFKPVVGQPGPDISSGYEYTTGVYKAGDWVVNEVGSIHQSVTKDEPLTLMAVWPSGYVFFPDEHLKKGVFFDINHDVSNEVKWTDDTEISARPKGTADLSLLTSKKETSARKDDSSRPEQQLGDEMIGVGLQDSVSEEMLGPEGANGLPPYCTMPEGLSNNQLMLLPDGNGLQDGMAGQGGSRRCNCKKAKCLKLYCVCFAAGK
eukprot:gene19105-25710_t